MTGSKKKRLREIEKKIVIPNYGLRVVIPFEALYADNLQVHLYWTDEPVKVGMDACYEEPYRRVEHPEGEKPTIKSM